MPSHVPTPDRSPTVQVNITKLIDEVQCYQTVRELRWPDGVGCPSCESQEVMKRGFDDTEPARQRYACHNCDTRFDDLTDTIFAGHHQPLKVWILCLYFMGLNIPNEQIAHELSINGSNRSGCDNRNHAAAGDLCSLAGSKDGAASPRKAASHAVVRYSKTFRCCCFNVATTVIMLSTKREPSALCVPKLPLRQSTPGRIDLSAILFVGSTPATCTNVHNASRRLRMSRHVPAVLGTPQRLPASNNRSTSQRSGVM